MCGLNITYISQDIVYSTLYSSGVTDFKMGLDLCASCGEEHEPPRGVKCRRTKLPKPSVKIGPEGAVGGERDALFTECDSPVIEHIDKKQTRRSRVTRHVAAVAVVEDDEERDLREQLERRARERRKQRLRAALEQDTDMEGSQERGRVRGKGAGRRKRGQQAKHGDSASESSTSTRSRSWSSETTSDSSSMERRRSRRRRKKKKRSKFALHKYTKNNKAVKRLNFLELMYAALLWGMKRAERIGMSVKDVQGYMGHLAYMTMHAITGTYTDAAYRDYDAAVRDKVKDKGIKYFALGDHELSLLYFNLDNSRSVRESRRPPRSSMSHKVVDSVNKVRGACYAHNYNKEGCTVKGCGWDHSCLICRNSDHVMAKCPNKRY